MSENRKHDILQFIQDRFEITLFKKNDDGFSFPKLEKIPRELVEIAEEVGKISGTWNPVEIYTPDKESIDQGKEQIFEAHDKGQEYNPVLTYNHLQSLNLHHSKHHLEKLLLKLKHLEDDKKSWLPIHHEEKIHLDHASNLFRTALEYKIQDDLATIELSEGLKMKNEKHIKHALKKKYPGTNSTLIKLAEKEFQRLTRMGEQKENKPPTGAGELTTEEVAWLSDRKVTPGEVAEAFRWALSQYGILRTAKNQRGFQVKIDPQTTAIDVRSKSPEGPVIFIPQDRKKPISTYKLIGLIAHEVEGHARQDVNGEELMFLGGGRLKIDNEELYEGLGLRYEHKILKKLFGLEITAPAPYYTFATAMAENGASFYEIFCDQIETRIRVKLKKSIEETVPLLSTFPSEDAHKIKRQAWMSTYRVMRGHIDMSNKTKFAMAKDLGYLRGYQMDQQLVDNELGHLNELGIIAAGALALLSEIKIKPEQMPLQFQDIASQYYYEVLKPQYLDFSKSKRPSTTPSALSLLQYPHEYPNF